MEARPPTHQLKDTMTHSPHTRRVPATLALVVVLYAVAGPFVATPVGAASDEDEGILGGALESDVPAWSYINAVLAGVQQRLDHLTAEPVDPSQSAESFRTWFNEGDRSNELVAYANNRTTADENVLKIVYKPNGADGEKAVNYLVTDVVDGNYTNATIVQSTDREVDESCTLRGSAARNAQEELANFYETFVLAEKDVTNSYLVKMRIEYGGKVSCTFLNSTGGMF